MSADDEIRILLEGMRLLGHEAQTELLARGWAVADLNVSDDDPLEFFWPPTAPVGYEDLTTPAVKTTTPVRHLGIEFQSPWNHPTRITRDGQGWRVDYGEAVCQQPSRTYGDEAALLDDLEQIEWWPMPVEEAKRLVMERVYATTIADAYDDHHHALPITEPYVSRLNELLAHSMAEDARVLGGPVPQQPPTWRPQGDLRARMRLVEAEAFVSAVRTKRAAGSPRGASG